MSTNNKERIVALVPCRAGSQRVKDKNVRDFAGESLLRIKLQQLLRVPQIGQIVVSTDDERVKEIARKMASEKIVINDENRPNIGSSNDEMVKYFSELFEGEGHLLWTHVTSPFIDEKTYSKAIDLYRKNLSEYDSLVSVKKIKEYIWDDHKNPVSYSEKEKGRWPRTQTLDPLFIINSGIFLIPFEILREKGDRVGKNPFFFEMSNLESLDIDWQEDFDMALLIWMGLKKADKSQN